MAIPVSSLTNRILRVLDDLADRDNPTYADEDIWDYLNNALTAIASHTAQERVYSKTLEADATKIVLPEDHMGLGPVSVTSGGERKFLNPQPLTPGSQISTSVSGDGDTYYEWPKGTLNFFQIVPSGYTVEVYYFGYWDAVESGDESLSIPRWMEEPIEWYCLHQAMAKAAASTAKLAQYKQRTDSGDPEDNPLLTFSRFCFRRYQELLSERPPQDRRGWEDR